jgi:hypothetical protein
MKFIDKQLALKLKEKGFDRPCFGWYNTDNEILKLHLCEGTTRLVLEHPLNCEYIIDAPTTDQVLEWLREEKDIDIVIYPIDRNTIYMGGEKYILSIYFCGKRDYKIHKDNNDKFVKWEDACIAGIKYVVEHLI